MNPLNDEEAIQILKTIAQARLQSDAADILPESSLRAALEQEFGTLTTTSKVTQGDLARAALDVLGQDPRYAEAIRVLSENSGSPQKYGDPSTILIATAAILVLQTRVKFKVDHTHKWSVELEKRALGDAALKNLIQHLLRFLRSQ